MNLFHLPFSNAFLDKYEILGKIGQGAMGVVYRGRHLDLNRLVAIKCSSISRAEFGEVAARFKREAKLMAAMAHANIVLIFEYIVDGNEMILVEELLEGETLDELVERTGALSWRVVVDYGEQIFSGLAAIHAKGVIHRDIKPSNVMLIEDGLVKIIDFGLAKVSTQVTAMTKTGDVLGTPLFMAPEQFLGENLSPAVDCFSVGVTLFYLLTKVIPHEGGDLLEILNDRANKPAPPLKDVVMTFVPNDLARLVDSLLELEPNERPSASDCLKCLAAIKRGEASHLARKKTPRQQEAKSSISAKPNPGRSFRKPGLLFISLVAFAVIVSSIFLWIEEGGRHSEKREELRLLRADVVHEGCRSVDIAVSSSSNCRAVFIVTKEGNKNVVATVQGEQSGQTWLLRVSGLLPGEFYQGELKLRERGRDLVTKKITINTKPMKSEMLLDVGKLVGVPSRGTDGYVLFSGVLGSRGRLFLNVGGQGVGLYGLEEKKLLWWKKNGKGGTEPKFLAEGILCKTNEDSISLYSPSNGKVLWQRKLNGDLAPGLCFQNGIGVVVVRHFGLIAFELSSGNEIWKRKEALLVTPFVCDEKYVFARNALLETKVYSLKDGVRQTSVEMFNRRMHPEKWLADGNEHYCCFANGSVIVQEGGKKPRLSLTFETKFNNLCFDDEMIYLLADFPPQVYALKRSNGELSWKRELPQLSKKRNEMKAMARALVIIDRDKGLFCFDRARGDVIYREAGKMADDFGLQYLDGCFIYARAEPVTVCAIPIN